MLPFPELNFRRTPVVLIVTALAAAIEVACVLRGLGDGVGSLRDTLYNQNHLGLLSRVWAGEYWQPLTTSLLHGDPIHAAFNIYGLLVLGGALERRFGSLRFGLLFVLLAYVSMLPQFMISNYRVSDLSQQHSVVGLSGILYGCFGMLLVGRRKEAELYEACNDQMALFMAAWFVFCVIADRMKLLQVANFAHAAGLIFGLLYGCVAWEKQWRWAWLVGATVASLLVLTTLFYVPGHELYQQHRQQALLRQQWQQWKDSLQELVIPPAK